VADLERFRRLSAFLAALGRKPMAWGEDDCCLMLANWAMALGRPDPAAHLRGRYTTERGCARVLRREGGVLAVVADCASRAGLREVSAPQIGDVGVVEADTARGVRATGGICLGRRWATRGDGIVVAERRVLRAWSVN
jgi:hypothetical protein